MSIYDDEKNERTQNNAEITDSTVSRHTNTDATENTDTTEIAENAGSVNIDPENSSSDKLNEDNCAESNGPCGCGASYSPNGNGEYEVYRYTGDKKSQDLIKSSGKKRQSSAARLGISLIISLFAVIAVLTGIVIAQLMREKSESPGIYDDQLGLNGGSGNEDIPAETVTVIKTNTVKVQTDGGNIGSEDMTIAQVVTLVASSVVEITTESVQTSPLYGQYVTGGAGSGVIIGKAQSDDAFSYYVVTNDHVVSGADNIAVRLNTGAEYSAELIGTDAQTDIAVLRIKSEKELIMAVMGDSNSLVAGEEVIAIGNPLGKLGGTITNGIISALERETLINGEAMTLMQTNAAVNPGNSGGGLFNMKGQLIGVVNAKSGANNVEGLGFAIPINTAYDSIKQIIEYGFVRGRIDHGLTVVDVTDSLYAYYEYGSTKTGVYIEESKYTDELKRGDRITFVNGIEIDASADISSALRGKTVGDIIKITVVRVENVNGKAQSKKIEVSIVLKEYVPTTVK